MDRPSVDSTLLSCSSDGPDIRRQLRFYAPPGMDVAVNLTSFEYAR